MTVFHSLLNNIFSVERLVKTPDAQGGWQDSYQPINPIIGRLRPASSTKIVQAAQELRSITHVLYTEASADVARGDKVTIDNLTVEIQALRNPSTSSEHYEFDALEVQQETTLEPGS